MDFIHLSHCVYNCDYHIVITTKYRRKIFNEGIFTYFNKRVASITKHYPLIKFKTVNHDKDHIHLQISVPPTMSVGRAVGIIKQNTASFTVESIRKWWIKLGKKRYPQTKKLLITTDSGGS